MTLFQNGNRLNTSTGRIFSGVTTIYGGGYHAARANFNRNGCFKSFSSGEHAIAGVTDRNSLPNGYRHPAAFFLPVKTGGLSSRNEAVITVSGNTSNASQGRDMSGTSSISLTTSGTAAAIASAIGSAVIDFSAAANASATVNAVGSATITFTADADLGAEAEITGTTTISFNGAGTLTAIGSLVAAPLDAGLTSEAIASAVWSAIAAANNTTGTMGEKLNDAGAAGNPWSALIAANNDPSTFGSLVQIMQTLITEVHRIQGLDNAAPMTVTPTTRTAGAINLDITGDGVTTTTVTRT